MNNTLLALGVFFFLNGNTVAQDRWEMSEFVIYLWGTPENVDLHAKARVLEDAGFTVVDWDADRLDVLSPFNLKAMIHHPDVTLVRSLSDHESVWGYHCVDEPYPESTFGPLAIQVKQLRQADSRHPAFVNMLSTGGEFLRTYMDVVRPDLLSFDYYQWWWGSDRYFEKLEQFRDAARMANVPLGSCIETTANPRAESGDRGYVAGNAVKLRQSVYTNLAYGVKSIEWFSASFVFEPDRLELTPTGRDVVALNQELKLLGPELIKLDSVDVFHSPAEYAGTRSTPRDYWIQTTGEQRKAPVVVGMFVDKNGTDFVYLVNCDIEHANSVTVKLQSKWLGIAPWNKPKQYTYAVEWFDREIGQWTPVKSSSSSGFTLLIQPGDGELFRIKTGITNP